MQQTAFAIRAPRCADAEALLGLFKQLDEETAFMLFEPGERQTTLKEQTAYLRALETANSRVMYLAEQGRQPVGFAVANAGAFARNRHSLSCVLGVRQHCWGLGIGKALLHAIEEWARAGGFRRLELTVMQHNARAVGLYLAQGFEPEGLRRNSLKVNGRFINELYLAKLLEPKTRHPDNENSP